MEKPTVSINILTKNRIMEFYGLLVSLRNQTYKNWNLVVIDESSPPVIQHKTVLDLMTRMKLEGHFVKYIHHNVSWMNIGKCRNEAIQHSPDELICRIDDDSICEKDYLEKLVKHITSKEDIGAVSGIVPVLGAPEMIKEPPKIFNKVTFDKEGKVSIADDGGHFYDPKVLPAQHLRSSFMFKKSVAMKAGLHPLEYGPTGYREETDFSLRIAYAGYKMLVDTGAICWHVQCPSGGGRVTDAAKRAEMNENHFIRKFKRLFKQKGNPYEEAKQ